MFEQMKAARFKPDMSTYTALLAAYHPAHKWRQALQVPPFSPLLRTCPLRTFAWGSVLAHLSLLLVFL